jgi:hypothetical protein
MDIDEWYAEKCGVRVREVSDKLWYSPSLNDDALVTDWWTIERADCREKIREKFGIDTVEYDTYSGGKRWEALTVNKISETGKTIKEAEIACMEAIYEAGK